MTPPVRARSSESPRVRELFKNRAYDELKSRFFNNQYEPGTNLSERQLAEELGMSKTPVKAALERLEMEGFITVSPQSGIVVRELSDAEISDIYDIRIALEGFVLKSIAGKLSAGQIELWNQNLQALKEVAQSPEIRQRAVALDAEFHLLPCEYLGNTQIVYTMQQLSCKMQSVINRVFRLLPDRASQSLVEHQEIVDAVRLGQGQRASDLVEAHLRAGHQILRAARNP
jgi:DNA-binding GntR family transcriptional regulator